MEKTYELVLVPQAEGGFTTVVPELPDVVSEGDTVEQAIAATQDAIEGYLEALRQRGWSVPSVRRATVVVEVPTL